MRPMELHRPALPVLLAAFLLCPAPALAAGIDNLTGNRTGDEGDTFSYTCTWDEPTEPVTFTWDFGDGSSDTDTVGESGGGISSMSHTFVDDGAYTVTCSAYGHDSEDSDNDSLSIVVDNVAPVASASGDTSGDEGATLAFDCSSTDAGSEDSATYAWDFGDGDSTTGASANHVFVEDGTYTVTCTATDDGGDSGSDSLTVVVANVAPEIGTLSGPSSADEGDSLSYAVSATDAGSTDTLSYAWDFGDGDTATGASASHTYVEDGAYDLVVLVCDDEGDCTDDGQTVTVANVAPTATLSGDGTGEEGESLAWSCATSDPGTEDTVSVSWDFGDGQSGAGASVTHAFGDDGSYVVTCTAKDDDGGATSDASTVVVSNATPVISATTVPSTGAEGESLSFAVTATDAGSSDTLTATWDFGDGAIEVGTTVAHAFDDDGSYTVTVSVCDDANACDSVSGTVIVQNLDPVVDSLSVDATADEGASVVLSATASDEGDDVLVYSWDFGDGDSATGDSVSHAWTDEGSYAITLVVSDDDGGSDSASAVITVSNVAPAIDSLAYDSEGEEGQSLTFDAFTSDPGSDDTLSVAWDFGDGDAASGDSVTHAYGDDGAYTVTVTVDDGSASSAEAFEVRIANAAPVLGGDPETSVVEGDTFSFTPTLEDPGALDTHTWTTTLPVGATFDEASLMLSWTPSWQDLGVHDLSLSVMDDDGGSAALALQLEVLMADEDGDGVSDGWEQDHGLDPDDGSDAEADTDGDGRTNAEEYERGTDPNSYDGPSVPVLASPEDGSEWAESELVLTVENASSPDGEALTYRLALYADAELTDPVAEVDGLVEGEDGLTGWSVDAALDENTWYAWWAAASDAFTDGDWSDPVSFFYNTVNDAPGEPGLVSPFDDSTVDDVGVTFLLDAATDVDEDALSYTVSLQDDQGFSLETADGLEAVDGQVSWSPGFELTDGVAYCWTAHATDEHGLEGEPALANCFTIDTDNQAPGAPTILSPEDGLAVNTLSPEVLVASGVDPEGRATEHLFELDLDPTFSSEALQSALVPSGEDGTTGWTPEPLTDNTWHYLRVTATDGAAWSESTEASFVVNVENDAPGVPTLQNPADGATVSKDTTLSLVNTTDADGDAITYEFSLICVATGEEIGSGPVEEDDAGTTSWAPSTLAPGSYTWTARGVDAFGLAGDWAEVRHFSVERPAEDPPESFCGCATGSGPAGVGWSLALLVGVVFRRRRSEESTGVLVPRS